MYFKKNLNILRKKMFIYHKGLILIRYKKNLIQKWGKKMGALVSYCLILHTHTLIKKTSFGNEEKKCILSHTSYFILHTSFAQASILYRFIRNIRNIENKQSTPCRHCRSRRERTIAINLFPESTRTVPNRTRGKRSETKFLEY